MYDNGYGIPLNDELAVVWYTLAAEQRLVVAQHNLGMMYANGEGLPLNDKTAVKWFTLAAEQGDAGAQSNLGTMYGLGQGVIQDYVYAHMWGNLGASNGIESGSELRDVVAEDMNPSQIAEAQKLARECVKNNYKGC